MNEKTTIKSARDPAIVIDEAMMDIGEWEDQLKNKLGIGQFSLKKIIGIVEAHCVVIRKNLKKLSGRGRYGYGRQLEGIEDMLKEAKKKR